jgi:hypothetical protein
MRLMHDNVGLDAAILQLVQVQGRFEVDLWSKVDSKSIQSRFKVDSKLVQSRLRFDSTLAIQLTAFFRQTPSSIKSTAFQVRFPHPLIMA